MDLATAVRHAISEGKASAPSTPAKSVSSDVVRESYLKRLASQRTSSCSPSSSSTKQYNFTFAAVNRKCAVAMLS